MDPRLVLALASVYVIWSSTYLVMKLAVAELPPLLMASMRIVAAGFVMLLVAMRRGVAVPEARDWLRVLPVGVLLFLGGTGLVAVAQQTVSSGGAAVVCATMPLWTGVFAWLSGDRPTRREWTSLAIGFIGIVVLVGGPSLSGAPVHIAMVIASPMFWGLGSVLARKLPVRLGDTFMLPAMQMILGGTTVAVVGLALGERIPADASMRAWAAVGYLFVAGSIIGFTAYNWLLRHTRPTVATSYAYVNPVLAVLLGSVLNGEPLGITTIAANALIVIAVMLALRKH